PTLARLTRLYGAASALLGFFLFSRRRRHTRSKRDWSSDVCSSDLAYGIGLREGVLGAVDLARREQADAVGAEQLPGVLGAQVAARGAHARAPALDHGPRGGGVDALALRRRLVSGPRPQGGREPPGRRARDDVHDRV